MLKKIALVLAAIVLVILGLAASKPDTFAIRRSASIAAPPDKVYALVSDFKAFNRWSPWVRMEPSVALTYSGPEAGVGAGYRWAGDKTGAGGMTITEATAPSKLVMNLEFLKPFESRNRVDFDFAPEGSGTKVTWSMSGPMTFLSKVMSVFTDMDTMIGPDFEAGLANLKAMAEGR